MRNKLESNKYAVSCLYCNKQILGGQGIGVTDKSSGYFFHPECLVFMAQTVGSGVECVQGADGVWAPKGQETREQPVIFSDEKRRKDGYIVPPRRKS